MQAITDRLTRGELSRRGLFRAAAGVAGGLALANVSPAFRAGVAFAQAQPFQSDLDVLNYALTLEQFEAALYNTVVESGVITSPLWLRYVTMFQEHENTHVRALTEAMRKAGGTPVTPPAAYNFAPFDLSTELSAMTMLAMVEEVGVGAYQGAAGSIRNRDLLTTAVSIHGVEAEHTASLHTLLDLDPNGSSLTRAAGISTPVLAGAFTRPIPMADVLSALAPILGG